MSSAIASADEIVSRGWRRIVDHTARSAIDLAAFRVFFGVYLLVAITPRFGWIAAMPDAFFAPPFLSHANAFSGFPPDALLVAADVAIPILAAGVALGVRARWCGYALVALCLFLFGFRFSFGKIDHNILVWVALALFSASNWGTRLALVPDPEAPRERHDAALATLAVCLCAGMFTAGFGKGITWVDFDLGTSGFLSWFYASYFSMGRQALLADMLFSVPPALFEAADYTAVLFELSPFAFLLAGAVAWRAWVVAACLFHLANTLTLNIPFHAHVVVYGAFVLLPAPRDASATDAEPSSSLPLALAIAVALLAIARVVQSLTADASAAPLIPPDARLAFALVVWGGLAAVGAFRIAEALRRNGAGVPRD